MSKGTTSYRIKDENALYFLTCATVEWIDVFTKRKYKEVFIESLNFCVEHKGLVVYGWVLMSNHFHVIARARDGFKLSNILRDMKKHIAKEVIQLIKQEPESRSSWLLDEMKKAGDINRKKQMYQLWRNDNHPIELYNSQIISQKLKYIHYNPVEEGIVEYPEEYVYSSAKDYSEMKGLVKIKPIYG
jgi:REP element-mobilizing transposase RayT